MNQKSLVAAEQALVPFHEWQIFAVRLPDGRIAASLASLCDLLNLARHGQLQRIRRDVVLADQLLQVVVQTSGGPQAINVLTAWAIPTWLNGLNPEMVAPEKRPMIVALKLEAADVLYRHFFKKDTDPADRPAPEEQATPRATRERPQQALPFELIYKGLEMVATGMEGLEQEHLTMQREIATLKGQIAEIQQWREARESAGPGPQRARALSMDHRIQLTVLAEALRSQKGEPIKSIYADLSKAFGVEEVNDIPDDRWQTVLSWLWQRGQQEAPPA